MPQNGEEAAMFLSSVEGRDTQTPQEELATMERPSVVSPHWCMSGQKRQTSEYGKSAN